MSPKEKEMREEHPKDEEPMVNAPQDESNVSKEIHHDTESQQQQKSTQQTKTMRKKSRLSSMMFLSANLYPEETNGVEGGEYPSSFCRRLGTTLVNVYNQYEFLIWIVIAICLARAYPPLGAEYLQPQITSTWIAVIFIFLLAGLGLKTEEFSKAFQRLYFNLFVQIFNFGVDSSVVFGVSKALLAAGALSTPLANGMVVCASLSMTINMVLVLTKSSGGDEASAIFNAAAGNMIGVFLTPLLVLGYLGVTGTVAMGEVFYSLAVRVVAPILVGQVIRKFSPATVQWYMKHKSFFKKAQELALVFIVYTVFCRTFADNADDTAVTAVDVVVMVVVEFACLVSLMALAWLSLRLLFRDEPYLRVMGLFGCTHKTVAMGVPLINAIYADDATIGLITLPLLIWHTMQLILGSFLAPKLAAWVEREEERLGLDMDDDDDNDGNSLNQNDNEDGEKQNDPQEMDETGRLSSVIDGNSNDTSNDDSPKNSTPTADVEQGQSDEESM